MTACALTESGLRHRCSPRRRPRRGVVYALPRIRGVALPQAAAAADSVRAWTFDAVVEGVVVPLEREERTLDLLVIMHGLTKGR